MSWLVRARMVPTRVPEMIRPPKMIGSKYFLRIYNLGAWGSLRLNLGVGGEGVCLFIGSTR